MKGRKVPFIFTYIKDLFLSQVRLGEEKWKGKFIQKKRKSSITETQRKLRGATMRL